MGERVVNTKVKKFFREYFREEGNRIKNCSRRYSYRRDFFMVRKAFT